ncbi:hypothetical protein Nwat_2703 [Nitrosococcus watsonii C-113]|uniref:Uncharacterized protein n=1 Tax=Nitrosococcus watsoni (strain C-113) TaxID=105559 RepID=D8KAP4_NITWC|nr:hypothetical protein Nwat_2703 [Nitrosococcus watsonii C-113]
MKGIKKLVSNRLLHLFLCFAGGILSLGFSYTPARSGSGEMSLGGPWSRGVEINPFLLTIGFVLLLCAWISYQKWKIDTNLHYKK